MAEIKTPHTGIVATHSGLTNGLHKYVFKNTNTGKEEIVNSSYDPTKLSSLFTTEFGTSEGMELASTLASTFSNLQDIDQRGFIDRAIKPSLRSIPAFLAGGGFDIAGLLSYVPGPDELAAMGYKAVTGDDPFGMLEKRREVDKEFRKDIQETLGSEARRKEFQQYLRSADQYANDIWGFKPFESTIGTDMTPEARGTFEKILLMGIEAGVSGVPMVKGATIPLELGGKLLDGAQFIFSKLAKDSVEEVGKDALKPGNVRSLIKKANDAYSLSTRSGLRNIRGEVAFGTAAGLATESSLQLLEKNDPDAANWLKSTIALGSGLLAPVATRSLVTGLMQGPIIKLGVRVTDPLLRPEVSAARYTQNEGVGTSAEDRRAIASVARILENSVAEGRHLDQASGLAFTTPELLRTEAGILSAKVAYKQELLDEGRTLDKSRLEKEINEDSELIGNLNRFANFQETVLRSAGRDANPGQAARFFQEEASRLVERRDQFFNYIENNFKEAVEDLDFGGRPGGTLAELNLDFANARRGATPVYEETRRKLVMRGDPKGVEGSEFAWLDPQVKNRLESQVDNLSTKMNEVLSQAQEAAEGRVQFWRRSVQSYLANRGLKTVEDLSSEEQKLVGDFIRGTYDDASREFRAFEKAAYQRISGLNDKVTENIVFPEGSVDPSTGTDISGMGIDDWAAGRLENLSRTEKFNVKEVPIQLAQLAGSRSVIAQLNRRRSQDIAAGRADAAQSRIPDLERQRDDIISQKTKAESELDAMESGPPPGFIRMPFGEASPKSIRDKRAEVLRLGKEAQGYQSDIDNITKKFLGADDDFVIEPTGRLTARDSNGDLVGEGVSANDVKETISDIAETSRRELASNGRTPKYRSLVQLRNTLEQLISPEVFPNLDPASLTFAKESSRLKNRIDDAQGDILAKDRGSDVKVQVEEIPSKILPETTSTLSRASNIRLLNQATAELPDFVTIKRGEDGGIVTDQEGIPVAAIDEDALIGGQSLFDRPDSPFEIVEIGEGRRPFEIRLKPDAPVSARSLDVAESILLERLSLRFPDGIDSKGLDSFKSKNKEAISFLQNNGRTDVPGLLNDADELASQLDSLKALRTDKARDQLNELVNSGQIDLQGLDVEDYIDYIGNRRRRLSEQNALSDVLDVEAGYATTELFDRVLNPANKQPSASLNEFLSLVKGNRAAEKGLQASIVGELFNRSTDLNPDLVRQLGQIDATVFNPSSFRELMANPRVRNLLLEAFPDNPNLLDGLDKMAVAAFETSNFVPGSPGYQSAINPQDAAAVEAWSNLGRIFGLQVADRVDALNSLVLAGAGSRMFTKIGKRIVGNKIKDILINAALDPEIAAGLAKKTSEVGDGFIKTIQKSLIDVVNVPKTISRRPAATVPILKRIEEEVQEDSEEQASLPSGPRPTRQLAQSMMPTPNPASALGQVSPVQPLPQQTAAASPETMQRGQQIFGANDPIFAKSGGIMSVRAKPRQMVG